MLGAKPTERTIRKPPVIAVEVLSPDDRAGVISKRKSPTIWRSVFPYV